MYSNHFEILVDLPNYAIHFPFERIQMTPGCWSLPGTISRKLLKRYFQNLKSVHSFTLLYLNDTNTQLSDNFEISWW
jgi:hypothetical protein